MQKLVRSAAMEAQVWSQIAKASKAGRMNECLSCYEASGASEYGHVGWGAQQRRDRCCNSCYELRRAFALKGLDPEDAMKHPQVHHHVPHGISSDHPSASLNHQKDASSVAASKSKR